MRYLRARGKPQCPSEVFKHDVFVTPLLEETSRAPSTSSARIARCSAQASPTPRAWPTPSPTTDPTSKSPTRSPSKKSCATTSMATSKAHRPPHDGRATCKRVPVENGRAIIYTMYDRRSNSRLKVSKVTETMVSAAEPIVLAGGTVIDGAGTPGHRRDVACMNGRLVPPSAAPADARVLDASGCIVAPGFIDIHTHYDAQVFWDAALTPSSFHGVTSVVAGNCGFTIAPTRADGREIIARTLENVEDMDFDALASGVSWEFETFPEYLAAVQRLRPSLNFACYVGHTALRLYVMGPDAYERAATRAEIDEMRRLLREALEAGGAGFSTSLAPTHVGFQGKPVPSRVAEPEELDALMVEAAAYGRGAIMVTAGDPSLLDMLYRRQPQLGLPITYGAILSSPSGIHRDRIDQHRRGVEAGADVWPQVTGRPLTFAFRMDNPFPLNSCPAFTELMSTGIAERTRAYADPAWRQKARRGFSELRVLKPRFDTFELAGTDDGPAAVTDKLVDVARDRGADVFDVLMDAAARNPGLWVRAIALNDDTDEVGALLAEPHCALGLSDAGAHVGQLCDAPQATDILGNWVRERGLFSLEEAVRRLTSAQADLLGFCDRGRLADGLAADVVVFDPSTVAPGPIERVRDFPGGAARLTAPSPSGVRHVLVAGLPIRIDEVQQDQTGGGVGTILRPGPRPAKLEV